MDDLARLLLAFHGAATLLLRLFFFSRRAVADKRGEARAPEGGSRWLIPLGLLLTYAVLVAYVGWGPTILPGGWPIRLWLLLPGATLLGVHAWLLLRAHLDLRHQWTNQLVIQPGHRLRTDGVYARIRHPMYTGVLAWALGALLVGQHLMWLATLPMVLGVVLRTRDEEAMLEAHFGDEWRAYRARSRRFF
jgi:protein-S-isoprenylcysteine O-methyltransferase Ste14